MSELIRGKLYMTGFIDPEPARRPAILQDNVTLIVNVMQGADVNIPDHITQVYWPIDDGPLPEMLMLHTLVDFIVAAIREDHCVLIHCYQGWNRSGLVSALVLRKLLNINGKEAVEMVRICRSPNALCNQTFANYVESLDAP